MNPNNVKQFNELLWLGVPKKDRDSIRGMVSTRYIDPSHIIFVELRHGDSDAFVQLSGEAEMMIKKPNWDRSDESVTMIATDYLKKVVDNITADHVTIKVKDRYPLTLEWKDGEDSLQVLIAQRVENERARRRHGLRHMRLRLPRL